MDVSSKGLRQDAITGIKSNQKIDKKLCVSNSNRLNRSKYPYFVQLRLTKMTGKCNLAHWRFWVGPLFLALVIGVLVGLRSLTPPAVVSWAAALYWIDLGRSRLYFIAAKPAVAILTMLALLELVADKLPSSPNRTAPPGLFARVVLGSLCGVCIAVAGARSPFAGTAVGFIGSLIGCFGGYQARTRLVKWLHCSDYAVAIAEDIIAIGGSLYVVTRF
jgi:uncharacterized membrane protein